MEPDPLDQRLAQLARATDGLTPPPELGVRLLAALHQRAAWSPWELSLAVFRRMLGPAIALALLSLFIAHWQGDRLATALVSSPEASPELLDSLAP